MTVKKETPLADWFGVFEVQQVLRGCGWLGRLEVAEDETVAPAPQLIQEMRALRRRRLEPLQQVRGHDLWTALRQCHLEHFLGAEAEAPLEVLEHVRLVGLTLLPDDGRLERNLHEEVCRHDGTTFGAPLGILLDLLRPVLQAFLGHTLGVARVVCGVLEAEDLVEVADDEAYREACRRAEAHVERGIVLETVPTDGLHEPLAGVRFREATEDRQEELDAFVSVLLVIVDEGVESTGGALDRIEDVVVHPIGGSSPLAHVTQHHPTKVVGCGRERQIEYDFGREAEDVGELRDLQPCLAGVGGLARPPRTHHVLGQLVVGGDDGVCHADEIALGHAGIRDGNFELGVLVHEHQRHKTSFDPVL